MIGEQWLYSWAIFVNYSNSHFLVISEVAVTVYNKLFGFRNLSFNKTDVQTKFRAVFGRHANGTAAHINVCAFIGVVGVNVEQIATPKFRTDVAVYAQCHVVIIRIFHDVEGI